VAALALVSAAGLAGCEVHFEGPAACVVSPPQPHQDLGWAEATLDIPVNVTPGQTFTVTVEQLRAFPGPPPQEPFELDSGTLAVTGPVTPSGNIPVGKSQTGGSVYPNTLTFTATGQPGDTITFTMVDGSNSGGIVQFGVRCTPTTDATIGTTAIVAPEGGGG
jgi:hypothetical protein